jgi:hypothetical protein
MASIGKAQATLSASNDAQNGELGERERGSDYIAKARKLNPFGHGPPMGGSHSALSGKWHSTPRRLISGT